jgi:hypothetical protein
MPFSPFLSEKGAKVMNGTSTNQLGLPENHLRKIATRILKGLLVAAAVAFVLGAVLFIALPFIAFNPVPTTYAIALGDLDNDGDLDAFYANGQNEGPRPNTVLLNQGGGKLFDSAQRLGMEESNNVTLGDLDGDGDLDAWVANIGYNSTFVNDGKGRFITRQSLFENERIGSAMWSIALGDVDGDGDLDALGGGCCGAISSGDGPSQLHNPYNMLWLNQGGVQGNQAGIFPQSGQPLESLAAEGAALGDLDGDGDLDAFFANYAILNQDVDRGTSQPNTIWWNDGQANFTDSGQRLGLARSTDVALGDLDGDGDLDAFVTNEGPNEVWFNAGGKQAGQPGTFIDSGQRLGSGLHRQVILARLDDDGDLDAAIVVRDTGSKYHLEVWLNDGQGSFTNSGQRFYHPSAQAFALGDLNGDGRVDILAGWFEAGYTIWWNQGGGKFTT